MRGESAGVRIVHPPNSRITCPILVHPLPPSGSTCRRQTQHPDWILYQCDRKTVAFWDGQTAPTGSVPLVYTNPDVIAWQVGNQSVLADSLGYDSMAFDNFGGGAREGQTLARHAVCTIKAGGVPI